MYILCILPLTSAQNVGIHDGHFVTVYLLSIEPKSRFTHSFPQHGQAVIQMPPGAMMISE